MDALFCPLCSRTFVGMISSWNTGAELSGSWTVEVGDLDEAGKHTFLGI